MSGYIARKGVRTEDISKMVQIADMEIVVDNLDNTDFSLDQVAELMHDAFRERVEQGLNLGGATIEVEELKQCQEKGAIFVAYGAEDKQMLGAVVIYLKRNLFGKEFWLHDFVGVSSSAKRLGIGSKMLEKCVEYAKQQGAEFIESCTAVKATSSVNWHLKNGFRIVKYASYKDKNYFSYVFRLQLRKPSFWNCGLFRAVVFGFYWVGVRLLLKEDGTATWLGKIVRLIWLPIKKRIKR